MLLNANHGDKRALDLDHRLTDAQAQVYNLQQHSYYLERQLERLITINPELQDQLDKRMAEHEAKLTEEQLKDQSKMAQMIANSTTLRSYEAIMMQYEQELEKKTLTIKELSLNQQQIEEENTNLGNQLYVLKTKFADGTGDSGKLALTSDEEKIDRIQKDQMVQLLKRNHDVLLEKYELFRSRNESLEKVAVEKESLYNDMKIYADKLSSKLFSVQKAYEEC